MSTTSSLVSFIVHFLVHRTMDHNCLVFVQIIASAYSKLPICHVLDLEFPLLQFQKLHNLPTALPCHGYSTVR